MSADGYYIKIPKNKSKLFYLLNDSVYKPIATEATPIIIHNEEPQDHTSVVTEEIPGVINPEVKNSKKKTNKTEPEAEPKRQKLAKVFYVVKRGDVLGDISDWFDCSNADIKKWNKLKGNQVQKGKKLTIFVAANKTGYYKRINKMPTKLKKKLKKKD